jgi:hypothetical protein
MANGTINATTKRATNVTLIDAAAGTADGVWIDAMDFAEGSLDVTISATATVQIRGSDAATTPADNTHGTQIGSDITSSSQASIVCCPRWLKARVSSFGSGTITVTATLRKLVVI